MKIDKVIFSTSEEYSKFWNLNSEIFKTKLGIDPVCLLFGKKANTDIHEKYGKVIEMEFYEDLPKVLQITWSKFNFPKTEPETTWMIGDIDQIPLSKRWFFDKIKNLPDDSYAHLNAGACAQSLGFLQEEWLNGRCDIPAHYHVAKGKVYQEFLELNTSFYDQIKQIVIEKLGSVERLNTIPDHTSYFWCHEEKISTKRLLNKIDSGRIFSFYYNNYTNKICRSRFDFINNDYIYSREQLKSKNYVDIHCERPFEKTKKQIESILNIAWGE